MNKYTQMVASNVDPNRVALEAQTDIAYLEADVNSLVVLAFRYALGRGDYCMHEVYSTIKANLTIIDKNLLEVISKEAREFTLKSPLDGIAEWGILADCIDTYLNKTKGE